MSASLTAQEYYEIYKLLGEYIVLKTEETVKSQQPFYVKDVQTTRITKAMAIKQKMKRRIKDFPTKFCGCCGTGEF